MTNADISQLHDQLVADIKGKECIRCESQPRVAWLDGTYGLRCNCYPQKPVTHDEPSAIGRRYWELMDKSIATTDKAGKAIAIRPDEIRDLLKDGDNLTDNEVMAFIRFCHDTRLNPFVNGEVYAIKYSKTAPFAIVIGLQARLKAAAEHPMYQGYQAGIILDQNGKPEFREGEFHLPAEKVAGGWAEIYRQDWAKPLRVTVALHEYKKMRYDSDKKTKVPMAQWVEGEGMMIMKCALNQGLRRAFPHLFYEMDQQAKDYPVMDEDFIEVVGRTVAPEIPLDPETGEILDASVDMGTEPPDEDSETPGIKTIGDLNKAAFEKYGIGYLQVCNIVGVKKPEDIRDFNDAWNMIENYMSSQTG